MAKVTMAIKGTQEENITEWSEHVPFYFYLIQNKINFYFY